MRSKRQFHSTKAVATQWVRSKIKDPSCDKAHCSYKWLGLPWEVTAIQGRSDLIHQRRFRTPWEIIQMAFWRIRYRRVGAMLKSRLEAADEE